MRRDVPALPVVGDHINRLLLELHDGADQALPAGRRERDARAGMELHHRLVRGQRIEHFDALDDAAVQGHQILAAQLMDVDGLKWFNGCDQPS